MERSRQADWRSSAGRTGLCHARGQGVPTRAFKSPRGRDPTSREPSAITGHSARESVRVAWGRPWPACVPPWPWPACVPPWPWQACRWTQTMYIRPHEQLPVHPEGLTSVPVTWTQSHAPAHKTLRTCVQPARPLTAREGAGALPAAEGEPQGAPSSITPVRVPWRKSRSMTVLGPRGVRTGGPAR